MTDEATNAECPTQPDAKSTPAATEPGDGGALSLDAKVELVMLKMLTHYGDPEKLRADFTERGKADPKWLATLDAWNAWYAKSEQTKVDKPQNA